MFEGQTSFIDGLMIKFTANLTLVFEVCVITFSLPHQSMSGEEHLIVLKAFLH
jgi:hypothetical protein